MKPLIYSSPYAWIFWIIFTLAYLPEFGLIGGTRPQAGESVDRGSMLVIMIAAWLGYPIAFSLAKSEHFHLSHEKFLVFPRARIAGLRKPAATLLSAGSWAVLYRQCESSARPNYYSDWPLPDGPSSVIHRWHVDARRLRLRSSQLDGCAGAIHHYGGQLSVPRTRGGEGINGRIGG